MSISDGLTDMIAPVLENAGIRLWELKVTKAGKRSIVSITLDKQGGVSVEDIAEMSKLIAPILDDAQTLDDAYHLEVASPGLERPLVTQDHFEWSLGMDITVSHRVDGSLVRARGKLVSVSPEDIQVETDEATLTIALDSITKAHTLFDFEAALKNGSLVEPTEETEEHKTDEDELQGELAQ